MEQWAWVMWNELDFHNMMINVWILVVSGIHIKCPIQLEYDYLMHKDTYGKKHGDGESIAPSVRKFMSPLQISHILTKIDSPVKSIKCWFLIFLDKLKVLVIVMFEKINNILNTSEKLEVDLYNLGTIFSMNVYN